MWLHTHPGTSVFELGLTGSGLRLMIFHKMSPRTHHTICNKITAKGPVVIYSLGEGGGEAKDLGLNKVKFGRSSL